MGLSGVGYGLFGLLWVLSTRDVRFADAVDKKTVQLFVGWFFLCILSTVMGYPIANIAHGMGCVAGAILGWTVAASPKMRLVGVGSLLLLTLAVLAGATIARPWVNLCKYAGGELARNAGNDEAHFGFDALTAKKDNEAVRWLRDAIRMNPQDAGSWYNLGIALQDLSQRNQAMTAYKTASDLDPGNKEFRSALDEMQRPTQSTSQ